MTKKGLEGAKEIEAVMESIRREVTEQIGGLKVEEFRDYREDVVLDYREKACVRRNTGLPRSNVLYFELEDGGWCCVRPSGTEPKIKFYIGVKGNGEEDADRKLESLTEALTHLAG